VVGAVLVSDGVGYASAGQTQGSDGGIVVRAFDPASGAVLWSKVIAPIQDAGQYREMRRNDLMLKVGDSIQLMLTRMNPKTGEFMVNPTVEYGKYMQRVQRARLSKSPLKEEPMTLTEVAPGIGLEGFMSGNWTRLGTRKHVSMNLGNVSGCMLSWDGQIVCAYVQNVKRISSGYFYLPRIEETPDAKSQDSQSIRAIRREGVRPSGQALVANATQWESKLPGNRQPAAVVVCGNAVVVGGSVCGKDARKSRGFIQTLSLTDGGPVAERTFPAPLTYNGLAVAGGRVYATFDDGSLVCLGAK
jgi:outer membrane protein assembly factor BamB